MGPATVDFANFAAGDDATRLSISQQFVTSPKDHGAARLLNCDVSEAATTEYLQLAAPFFALPLHVKQRITITPRPEPQRGYGAEGSEPLSNLDRRAQDENSSKRSEVIDVREHFDAGPPGDKRFPNAFPDETELPHFEQAMASYWTIFQQASFQLLEAIELGLNLPKDALQSLCREPCSELRFNHYPQVPLDVLAAGGKQRAAPHSDIGIISLLFQDDVGGLEIEDRRNSTAESRCFIPVPAAGSRDVVLLVGDTLERWTNGVIKAAVHRVSPADDGAAVSDEKQPKGYCPERYSGAFFAKPDFEASVAPLAEFGRPDSIKDITYLAYHQGRLGKVYRE